MTEAVTFKPGDLVSLRSGSPIMTVSSISAEGVVCEWWNDSECKFEWREFRHVVLDLESEE
ncbi:DUF2158 domain-containing protein [Sphingomonas sp. NPDC019816]|uniref:DUF2158 domain-containing protein n=1 Tax=Sphingomonas sp. NPDC019816 TaxID=3390679 RepID=UPI003D05776E